MNQRNTIAGTVGALFGSLALGGIPSPAHASFNDINPASASQCTAAEVNDVNTAVLNCLVSNAQHAYVRVSGVETELAPLAVTSGLVGCEVEGLNNTTAGNEIVVGTCPDAAVVPQAVVWRSSAPSTAPILEKPLPILAGLRLSADVKTRATAFNLSGTVVGVSISGTDDETPVFWSATGTPITLPAPLLGSNSNCMPLDINDRGAVVGNCPAGLAGSGKVNAILWVTTATSFVILPVPSGAAYCSASEMNINGQILANAPIQQIPTRPWCGVQAVRAQPFC